MKNSRRNSRENENPEVSITDPSVLTQPWHANLEKVTEQWSEGHKLETIEDAFSITVDCGKAKKNKTGTHLFGKEVRLIPYDDGDDAVDAKGREKGRGDCVLSHYFPPGSIGFAIKHYRPKYRTLTADINESILKEHLKLQDTHIELVIGVEREGKPGVITLNNPQDYQNGRFGDPEYPMIFVKIKYPKYIPNGFDKHFENNIRTMMAGFNAVSKFPEDNYNGGDPLAAYNLDKITEHCCNMILAIAGEKEESSEAKKWFRKEENLIYCAELAHIATNAGLFLPLNKETFEPLVGQKVWESFVEIVNKHNSAEETPFTSFNANPLAKHVRLDLAPSELFAITKYAPNDISNTLAFRPLTMADIVFYALSVHFPREELGEKIAPIQALVLRKMKPGLLEAMAIDKLPEDNPQRIAVEDLLEKIAVIVEKEYSSYKDFMNALNPALEQARLITSPRPGCETGKGYFVPPSLIHLVAMGKHGGGLVELEYVGHGLHFSMLEQR